MFNRATALTPSELKFAIARDPLIVKPDTTVMDAIAQMINVPAMYNTTKTADGQLDQLYLEARASCVLVVEDGRLLGILTEWDVVRLSAQQRSLENLAIRGVMVHPVITLHESAFIDLFFAINLLQQHQIRYLPILDEQDRPVGLVTDESLQQISRPIDILRLRLVSEVMTSEVICATPDTSMLAIAQLMVKYEVSSVIIVQTSCQAEPLQIPVGIVTERDIVQFQALGLNLETCLAAAELQRQVANNALHRLNQDLEGRLKQRTQELQAREAQLRDLFENATDLIQSVSPDGRILFVNRAWKETLGYNDADLEQWSIFQIIHPDDLGHFQTAIQSLFTGALSLDIETRFLTKDGREIIVEGNINCQFQDEQPIATRGIFRDITQRKQSEAKLHKLSQRLALSFKSGGIGCWDWDIVENTILWDERMYELYGFTKPSDSDVVYDIWANRLHPDDRTPAEALIQQAVLGQAEYDTEFRVVHPDGSIHFIKAYGVVVRDAQGNPQSMIGVNFNLSDVYDELRLRKQAEKTIRQQVEREQLLREITQKIRQSLDLQTIFDIACQEIRSVIQADRVAIFKFYPESNFDDGEFVAESAVEGFSSVLAIRVHDHCFGESYSSLYALGRSYVVDDIYNGGMTSCHTDILAQFQVRANLIMPFLCGNKLWGLLCIHQCATARHWQQSEIDFTLQLANQLAIAIQQANLYEQIQSELLVRQQAEARIALELRRQHALGAIIQKIRQSLDINEILATVTQQVKDVMHSDRVIVFRVFADGRSQIVEEALSGEFPALKDRHWDDEVWSEEILDCYWQGKPRIVPDVMNDIWTDCLVEYSIIGQIQSKIVAPILQEVRGSETHRWVAPWENNKLWGVLVVHACQEKRVWKDSEAQLLQQIANQLAIAIQQASLFEQLQQELAKGQQAEAKLTESNQELARATRLKDEFLANMSHELRTPLNAILGMTEGLQEEVFGIVNDQQVKALQTIEGSGSHLLELINDILDVATIEAGQIKLDCTSASVADLCQSSLAFIKQQAFQKRIKVEIKLQLNLPDLLVDERRIRQVLINLLNNAVKFTSEGGRITLEVAELSPDTSDSSEQHFLRIAVNDTGIGISPENIKQLFQPFVQIDSALNRQYPGTGLGLALVKRIVELHGGRVGLTSQLDVGSCFTIELPCTPGSLLSPELTAGNQPPATLKLDFPPVNETKSPALLILLAEDNQANISTVSSYLGAKGYRILLATNGQEAIDLATTHQPDLILMDIQMSGMDGLEAMRQIRLDPNLIDIPIIALTALAMTGDRDRCLEAGANEYLTKPVKLKQLTTTIQQLLIATKANN
ncbi:MAG: GAF domain-containing protein [Nostoc sp.]|uniref:GAF domain-containing protein n=1 Tax=Nostoc sp. TaxID=1180 RepID=UPI002FF98FBC